MLRECKLGAGNMINSDAFKAEKFTLSISRVQLVLYRKQRVLMCFL